MQAYDYNVNEDGLFVEAYLSYGEDWTLFEDDHLSGPIQTHTSYTDEEGHHVFGHPFEYHFACRGAVGWPKLTLKVWRLDGTSKEDSIAYGVVNLPNECGFFDLEVPTWRPMSTFAEESYNFYLGGPPKLVNSNSVVKNPEQRKYLTTMSSGTIHIQCEVIKRNFAA